MANSVRCLEHGITCPILKLISSNRIVCILSRINECSAESYNSVDCCPKLTHYIQICG